MNIVNLSVWIIKDGVCTIPLTLLISSPAGLVGQQKPTGLFGQSPMLNAGGNPGLGGGLFSQANTTGLATGGLFGNKPQTSGTGILGAGLPLGQTGGLQLGQLGQLGQGLGGGLGQAAGGIFGGKWVYRCEHCSG